MEIDINQKKISIGDKYQIFIDGTQAYHAAAKIFRIFADPFQKSNVVKNNQ